MSKELVLRYWDDYDSYWTDKKTEASGTVQITYRGKPYELDLTQEHAAQLDDLLRPWLQAAHPPEQPESSTPAVAAVFSAGELKASRRYYAGMRKFADEHGFTYTTPNGHNYYSSALREAYAGYLAARGSAW